MHTIHIPTTDLYDYKEERFFTVKAVDLMLEHSLLSLSKWESKHHKPLLENENITNDELVDYVRCMTINRDVDPLVYNCLTTEQFDEIQAYMDDPMTATWFSNIKNEGRSGQKVTAELIYSWMIDLGIWKECEKWHLRQLVTLIQVRSEEMKPKKTKNKAEALAHYRNLKAARRAKKKH